MKRFLVGIICAVFGGGFIVACAAGSWFATKAYIDNYDFGHKSAYELALEQGYEGTLDEWLAGLKGGDGLSAYQEAVLNGFDGSEAEWLASLKGDKGADAYNSDRVRVLTVTGSEFYAVEDFLFPELIGSGETLTGVLKISFVDNSSLFLFEEGDSSAEYYFSNVSLVYFYFENGFCVRVKGGDTTVDYTSPVEGVSSFYLFNSYSGEHLLLAVFSALEV
jgi:hypothetical protein